MSKSVYATPEVLKDAFDDDFLQNLKHEIDSSSSNQNKDKHLQAAIDRMNISRFAKTPISNMRTNNTTPIISPLNMSANIEDGRKQE